jgi:hypothetical protein
VESKNQDTAQKRDREMLKENTILHSRTRDQFLNITAVQKGLGVVSLRK